MMKLISLLWSLHLGSYDHKKDGDFVLWLENQEKNFLSDVRMTMLVSTDTEITDFLTQAQSSLKNRNVLKDVNNLADEYHQSKVGNLEDNLPSEIIFALLQTLPPFQLAKFQRINKRARLIGSSDSLWRKFLVDDVILPLGTSAREAFLKKPELRKAEYMLVDKRGKMLAESTNLKMLEIRKKPYEADLLKIFSKVPRFNTHFNCKKVIVEMLSNEDLRFGVAGIHRQFVDFNSPLKDNPSFMNNFVKALERHSYSIVHDDNTRRNSSPSAGILLGLMSSPDFAPIRNNEELMQWFWRIIINKGFPKEDEYFFSLHHESIPLLLNKQFRENFSSVLNESISDYEYKNAGHFLDSLANPNIKHILDDPLLMKTLWKVTKEWGFNSFTRLFIELGKPEAKTLAQNQIFLSNIFEATVLTYLSQSKELYSGTLFGNSKTEQPQEKISKKAKL